jgi:hypothetical protein
MQDIVPEEKQNDFKQPGDRYRKMSPRECVPLFGQASAVETASPLFELPPVETLAPGMCSLQGIIVIICQAFACRYFLKFERPPQYEILNEFPWTNFQGHRPFTFEMLPPSWVPFVAWLKTELL